MPKSEKYVPFAEKMRQNRHQAIDATTTQVAADIWGELVYIFSCYSAYELECFKAVTVTATKTYDRLILDVTTTSCKDDSEKTEEWEVIYMSAGKLNNLTQIMKATMQIAEREGVKTQSALNVFNQRLWRFSINFE